MWNMRMEKGDEGIHLHIYLREGLTVSGDIFPPRVVARHRYLHVERSASLDCLVLVMIHLVIHRCPWLSLLQWTYLGSFRCSPCSALLGIGWLQACLLLGPEWSDARCAFVCFVCFVFLLHQKPKIKQRLV